LKSGSPPSWLIRSATRMAWALLLGVLGEFAGDGGPADAGRGDGVPADRIQQTSSVASTSLSTLITSAVFLPYDSVTGPCSIFSRARSLIAATSALKVLVIGLLHFVVAEWPESAERAG